MDMLIPSLHICHLIDALPLTNEEKEGAMGLAQSHDPVARKSVLDMLPPNDVKALRENYRYERPRTLRIWRIQPFDKLDSRSLYDIITHGKQKVNGKHSTTSGDRKLLFVANENDYVRARIRIKKLRTIQNEDASERHPSTIDIDLDFRLHGTKCIMEAYAGQVDSRSATRFFLEWALGRQLPARRPDIDNFMAPIVFSDTKIVYLAALQQWPRLKTDAVNTASRNGRTIVHGPETNGERDPLEESEVTGLLAAPQITNDFRVSVPHSDGYTERVDFEFAYKAHSSFGPVNRCSVTAMRFVADAVLSVV